MSQDQAVGQCMKCGQAIPSCRCNPYGATPQLVPVEQISALQAELASFKQDYCSLFTNLTKDHSVTKEQRDTLKRENAELAADKERLDWLERLEAPSISQFGARNWQIYVNGRRFMGVFLRMAIDSAREALDAARKEPHAS